MRSHEILAPPVRVDMPVAAFAARGMSCCLFVWRRVRAQWQLAVDVASLRAMECDQRQVIPGGGGGSLPTDRRGGNCVFDHNGQRSSGRFQLFHSGRETRHFGDTYQVLVGILYLTARPQGLLVGPLTVTPCSEAAGRALGQILSGPGVYRLTAVGSPCMMAYPGHVLFA